MVWSGDNPCSLVGLGVTHAGSTAVSLGTSDTLFGITAQFRPRHTGNILTNPVDNTQKMILLCFKNGSLARQGVQEACAGTYVAAVSLGSLSVVVVVVVVVAVVGGVVAVVVVVAILHA